MKKILVNRQAAGGDVLLTTPIIRHLRKINGDNCTIDFCVQQNHAQFITNNPHITRIITDRPSDVLIAEYDQYIDLDLVYERNPKIHAIDAYALHTFGTCDIDKRLELHSTSSDIQVVEKYISEINAPYVVLHMRQVYWASRNISTNFWRKLVDYILERTTLSIVQIGGPTEPHFSDSNRLYDLRGALSITQLYELINRAKFFIGGDSAPTHIAGATATPILALYTSVRSDYRRPFRDNAKFIPVHANIDCYGCHENNPPPCTTFICKRGDVKCVEMFDAIDIGAKLLENIDKTVVKNNMEKVLCSISTRGRYDTTLGMSIAAVINQTRKIDHLVIFDDNDADKAKDMREIQHLRYLLHVMDCKGISWQVIWGKKLGQHHNHQMANTMGFKWVWRVDDDCVPDYNVLERLMSYVDDTVGGVGGAILTPPFAPVHGATGEIWNIDREPNIQWDYIKDVKEVDHLHCSFLYRAGVANYNLGLSRAAFREETLFTYELRKQGYKLLVIPDANTWHLKNSVGGVRTEQKEMFEHDDKIFRNYMNLGDRTVVILDCGMGDHIVFRKMMNEISNPMIFTCYPEIVPGRSIGEAKELLGDISTYNVYYKMDQWNWRGSLIDAFRKLYVEKSA